MKRFGISFSNVEFRAKQGYEKNKIAIQIKIVYKRYKFVVYLKVDLMRIR